MAQSKQDELYKALQQKGYPDSLCREIAYKQMNTDYNSNKNARLSVPHIRSATGRCGG